MACNPLQRARRGECAEILSAERRAFGEVAHRDERSSGARLGHALAALGR